MTAKASQNKLKIFFITSLYAFQGIPQGFSNLMVLLLLSAKSSYKDIAIFSTTYYPYSLKLLWSPLVDSIFWKKIGRRRSWILPTQFVTAIAFIALGTPAHFFMRENQKSEFSLIEALINQNEIAILTSIFMLLFVCTSTQDIALDAWGLQLLPGEINHLVSTCQTAGLNLGNAIGYNAVILLTSDKFSSLTSFKPVTVGGFCLFVGFFAIFLNFWILFFVAESPYKNEKEKDHSTKEAYSSIVTMISNSNIRQIVFIALTSVAPFAPNMFLINSYSVDRKFVSKELLALLDILSVPICLCIPIFSKNKRFLENWLWYFNIKLAVSASLSLSVLPNKFFQEKIFLIPFCIFHTLFNALDKLLFIQFFAFCSKICDETFGGTYLTFLAVTYNLGHVWVKNTIFGAFDYLEFMFGTSFFDGYIVASIVCSVLGILWSFMFAGNVRFLSRLPISDWKLNAKDKKVD